MNRKKDLIQPNMATPNEKPNMVKEKTLKTCRDLLHFVGHVVWKDGRLISLSTADHYNCLHASPFFTVSKINLYYIILAHNPIILFSMNFPLLFKHTDAIFLITFSLFLLFSLAVNISIVNTTIMVVSDAVIEILSKLLSESLLWFKSVCKFWYALINDLKFVTKTSLKFFFP